MRDKSENPSSAPPTLREGMFRQIVESTSLGYFFYQHDRDGVFTYVSPSIHTLLGYTPQEFACHYGSYMTDSPDNEQVSEFTRRCINGVNQPPYDVEIYHKDGSIRLLEVLERPVCDKSGSVIGLEGIAHDVTARRKEEKQRSKRLTEIERVNEEMMDLLEDLKSTNRRLQSTTEELTSTNVELESFSYSVSHDLRAPIRAIRGYAEALSEDYATALDNTAQSYIRHIEHSAEVMGEQISSLLSLSQLGRTPLTLVPAPMEELVNDVVSRVQFESGTRDVDITVGQLGTAMGDPALLRHVWTNLLSNAIKFTRREAHARIEIDSRTEDDHQLYWIKDNGVGFDMKSAVHLFGAFQRLHKRSDFEGTGVGLAIVRRIVRRHGGRIWAEASENQGATFIFTLPSAS